MVTYDVWFDDDGVWRCDTRNVDRARADEIAKELTEAGYLYTITLHNPDLVVLERL